MPKLRNKQIAWDSAVNINGQVVTGLPAALAPSSPVILSQISSLASGTVLIQQTEWEGATSVPIPFDAVAMPGGGTWSRETLPARMRYSIPADGTEIVLDPDTGFDLSSAAGFRLSMTAELPVMSTGSAKIMLALADSESVAAPGQAGFVATLGTNTITNGVLDFAALGVVPGMSVNISNSVTNPGNDGDYRVTAVSLDGLTVTVTPNFAIAGPDTIDYLFGSNKILGQIQLAKPGMSAGGGFTFGVDTVTDGATNFKTSGGVTKGQRLVVSGSVSNDGTYTVVDCDGLTVTVTPNFPVAGPDVCSLDFSVPNGRVYQSTYGFGDNTLLMILGPAFSPAALCTQMSEGSAYPPTALLTGAVPLALEILNISETEILVSLYVASKLLCRGRLPRTYFSVVDGVTWLYPAFGLQISSETVFPITFDVHNVYLEKLLTLEEFVTVPSALMDIPNTSTSIFDPTRIQATTTVIGQSFVDINGTMYTFDGAALVPVAPAGTAPNPRVVYVEDAPLGSDANSGAQNAPVATIDKALQLVDAAGGGTIYLLTKDLVQTITYVLTTMNIPIRVVNQTSHDVSSIDGDLIRFGAGQPNVPYWTFENCAVSVTTVFAGTIGRVTLVNCVLRPFQTPMTVNGFRMIGGGIARHPSGAGAVSITSVDGDIHFAPDFVEREITLTYSDTGTPFEVYIGHALQTLALQATPSLLVVAAPVGSLTSVIGMLTDSLNVQFVDAGVLVDHTLYGAATNGKLTPTLAALHGTERLTDSRSVKRLTADSALELLSFAPYRFVAAKKLTGLAVIADSRRKNGQEVPQAFYVAGFVVEADVTNDGAGNLTIVTRQDVDWVSTDTVRLGSGTGLSAYEGLYTVTLTAPRTYTATGGPAIAETILLLAVLNDAAHLVFYGQLLDSGGSKLLGIAAGGYGEAYLGPSGSLAAPTPSNPYKPAVLLGSIDEDQVLHFGVTVRESGAYQSGIPTASTVTMDTVPLADVKAVNWQVYLEGAAGFGSLHIHAQINGAGAIVTTQTAVLPAAGALALAVDYSFAVTDDGTTVSLDITNSSGANLNIWIQRFAVIPAA